MTYSSSFFDEIVSDSLSSAKVLVPLVMDCVCPKSVVDVGCATGAWLSVFKNQGVETVVGLDGGYVKSTALLMPSDCFRVTDLEKPFSSSEEFDLAVSLEVAEHLPAESAQGFVQSLCQLAPVILFSAAVPGQTGTHHVNEQWPQYWRELFAAHRFKMFDPFRPLIWNDQRVALWYRQNVFLYIHEDLWTIDRRFSNLCETPSANDIMLIDANIFFGVTATVKRLPYLFARSIRHRFSRVFMKGPN
jgi:hypothetical protein